MASLRNRSNASETPIETEATPPPATPRALKSPAEERPSFWDHLAQLDEGSWTHHKIYLYRLEPKIDKSGENAFISIYQRPIDQQDVLTDHGSGRYLAMLNDTRARKGVNKITFTVHNEAFPPKVKQSQLVACPENEKWMEWLGQMKTAAPTATAKTDSAPDESGLKQLASIIQRVIDNGSTTDANSQAMLMKAANLSMEMVAKHAGTGTDLNGTLDALVKARAIMAPATSQPDSMATLEMFMKLMDRMQPPPAPDPLKSLDGALALLERVKGLTGDGQANREPAPWWERMAPALGTMLAPIVAPVFAKIAGGGSMIPPTPAPANFSADQPPPAGAELTDPPATAQVAYSDEQIAEIQQIVMAAARPMFKFLGNGQTGLQFADYFIEGNSLREWQILKNFGYDNLLKMIQMNKSAWEALAPLLQQFQTFMAEFYSWTPEENQDDAGQPLAPPVAA